MIAQLLGPLPNGPEADAQLLGDLGMSQATRVLLETPTVSAISARTCSCLISPLNAYVWLGSRRSKTTRQAALPIRQRSHRPRGLAVAFVLRVEADAREQGRGHDQHECEGKYHQRHRATPVVVAVVHFVDAA